MCKRGGSQVCKNCGGPLYASAKYGYCKRWPECKRLGDHAYDKTRDRDRRLGWVRKRAKEKGVSFTLTLSSLPSIPDACPCCSHDWGKTRATKPALDRISPSLGYVPGNVQWLCGRCNRLKQDATPEELMQLALFMQGIAA